MPTRVRTAGASGSRHPAAGGFRWQLGSRALALACCLALVSLQGCASFGDFFGSKKDVPPEPPEKIYADADGYLSKKKYADAAVKFEEVDKFHPYAPQARRALVMQAWALYKAQKYADAISAARRYTTMHPGTKEAALAQHIIATSFYEDISDPNRDQSAAKNAVQEYKVLLQRYPDSEYAKQAQNRLRLSMEALAAAEMNVGRYYLKQNNHLAAINRFKVVVTDYQTTAHVEEALMRLTEAYMLLGITNEAQTAAAVLGHNFPNSPWYKDSYALLRNDGLTPKADQGSWISKAWKTTVGQVTVSN
jgi:outer membrane protein assembly factor BamD